MTVNTPPTAALKAVLETALELAKGVNLETALSEELVPLIKALQALGAYSTAVNAQIEVRAITNNEAVPGVAVKDATVHRKWHDDKAAEELARETFGDAAFSVSLKSPAQIEKLPGGDVFVAVTAFKPPAPKKVVY